MQRFIKFINKFIFRANILLIVLLVIGAILGIWEIIDTNNLLFWQIILTLVAILTFNLILIIVIVGVYRENLKIIDIFDESQYATQHKADEIIFSTGDIGHEMYLLVKGKVEISVEGKVLEIVEAGSFFGELAIIENLPRSATARCINDCKLVTINEKRFYELIQEVPFVAQQVMKIMAHRLRKLDNTSIEH